MSSDFDSDRSRLDLVWQAQWGPGFNVELMQAIWCVRSTERWIANPWPEGQPDDEVLRESLAKERTWVERIRQELEARLGSREAYKILEKHQVRLEEFLAKGEQRRPNLAIAAYIDRFLSQGLGRPPTDAERDELVTALQVFGREVAAGARNPDCRPFGAMKCAAEARAGRQYPENKARWTDTFWRQLVATAERIERERPFPEGRIRTGKLRGMKRDAP